MNLKNNTGKVVTYLTLLTEVLIKMLRLAQVQNKNITSSILYNLNRWGHTLRGKPPGIARSLEQRLLDENPRTDYTPKVNIGFPKLRAPRNLLREERLNHLKEQKNNLALEKLARLGKLKIDLDKVKNERINTNGPFQIQRIAQHYGIFEHLFEDGYFVPRIPLNISYNVNDDVCCPVYTGNILKPSEASVAPTVEFNSTFSVRDDDKIENSLYSLLLTNPDGHLEEKGKEYVQWFVSNIPNGDVNAGDLLVPYLQPFPSKGTGYQRYIFILYKQEKKIDFSEYKINDPFNLNTRTFKTIEFYTKHQDSITPAGLAFFQSDWEPSLTEFYHKKLNIAEPIFEYDFPKPYIKDPKWFPLKEPFNLYMDKYRDEKEIKREYLERKLAKIHPFDGPEKPLRFPNAHSIKNVPSWLKTEIKKDRLRWGRINDV